MPDSMAASSTRSMSGALSRCIVAFVGTSTMFNAPTFSGAAKSAYCHDRPPLSVCDRLFAWESHGYFVEVTSMGRAEYIELDTQVFGVYIGLLGYPVAGFRWSTEFEPTPLSPKKHHPPWGPWLLPAE